MPVKVRNCLLPFVFGILPAVFYEQKTEVQGPMKLEKQNRQNVGSTALERLVGVLINCSLLVGGEGVE